MKSSTTRRRSRGSWWRGRCDSSGGEEESWMSFLIYFDEDSQDSELVRILRARGVDVSTVNEEGMRSRKDEEQLIFAATKGRAIFTFNVPDFARLHAAWMR